jgi:chromosome segregation protein
VEEARRAVATTEGRAAERAARAAEVASHLETARARLAAIDEVLRSEDGEAMGLAARSRGGRLLLDGVEVDRPLQRAIEAALGPAVRSALLPAARVPSLRGERGHLVIEDAPAPRTADRDASRAADAARGAGGGRLSDAVLRDPGGALGRLLAGALWVPELEAALRLQPALPAGWCVATPGGDVVTAAGTVALGGSPSVLERRDERDALRSAVVAAQEIAEEAARASGTAASESGAARQELAHATERLAAATRERRRADETERSAARSAEATAREFAWESAQSERLAVEQVRATEALGPVQGAAGVNASTVPGSRSVAPPGPGAAAAGAAAAGAATADFATLEQAVRDLRARRDRLSTGLRDAAGDRRRAEGVRSRAEASLVLDEARLADIGRETARVTGALEARRAERNRVTEELAALSERDAAARHALGEIVQAGRSDRDDLAAAEQQAARSRERLRSSDDAARSAERAVTESRLTEETVREQLLIELAALGPWGLSALTASAGTPANGPPAAAGTPGSDRVVAVSPAIRDDDDLAAALEASLDLAVMAWERIGDAPPPPLSGRLATLRRRFHGLGASDPYVTGEYVELKARLEQLEAQKVDLVRAIEATRSLIAELRTRVFEQFQAAFRELEGAFERQFTRLFGGGTARLRLTDPDDLETTGIDVAAQPPGKKRQTLALLSGGERALTAVALLFAMLEVRPVPFCVLDEVDAALDEVNIDRFVASLRDLAERTQCIVITHNRGTIEAADALHGVTLGADAVSRIVSLRLEDAIDQAPGPVADALHATNGRGRAGGERPAGGRT